MYHSGSRVPLAGMEIGERDGWDSGSRAVVVGAHAVVGSELH